MVRNQDKKQGEIPFVVSRPVFYLDNVKVSVDKFVYFDTMTVMYPLSYIKTRPLIKAFVFIGGVLMLVATCHLLYVELYNLNGLLLAPWDGTFPEWRPPSGTVMRKLNDFFATDRTNKFFGMIVIIVIGVIFLIRMKRDNNKFFVPFEFALANLIFIGSAAVGSIISILVMNIILPEFDIPYHVGYHYTGLGTIVLLSLLISLFWIQYRGLVVLHTFVRRIFGK